GCDAGVLLLLDPDEGGVALRLLEFLALQLPFRPELFGLGQPARFRQAAGYRRLKEHQSSRVASYCHDATLRKVAQKGQKCGFVACRVLLPRLDVVGARSQVVGRPPALVSTGTMLWARPCERKSGPAKAAKSSVTSAFAKSRPSAMP